MHYLTGIAPPITQECPVCPACSSTTTTAPNTPTSTTSEPGCFVPQEPYCLFIIAGNTMNGDTNDVEIVTYGAGTSVTPQPYPYAVTGRLFIAVFTFIHSFIRK